MDRLSTKVEKLLKLQDEQEQCSRMLRYNDQDRVFRNKKKLKDQKIRITKSLTKTRMDKLKQSKENFGLTNAWTNDGKIFFKPDSNAKPQVYYS